MRRTILEQLNHIWTCIWVTKNVIELSFSVTPSNWRSESPKARSTSQFRNWISVVSPNTLIVCLFPYFKPHSPFPLPHAHIPCELAFLLAYLLFTYNRWMTIIRSLKFAWFRQRASPQTLFVFTNRARLNYWLTTTDNASLNNCTALALIHFFKPSSYYSLSLVRLLPGITKNGIGARLQKQTW